MAKKGLLSSLLLYPLSRLYGLGVEVRNLMFNKGLLKQHQFDVPVIVVGNLTVGGAGKTPHTEYIINSLCGEYRIGMLSRGYRRQTKGFVLASRNSRPEDIGDEPYQIYRKFEKRGVMVAVCEKRVDGIKRMLELNPSLNLIVLDDAFQHRYVKPGISIILTEHSRPVYEDSLLPFGRLREPIKAMDRADIVVLTKCPEDMKPVDYSIFGKNFDLFPYQQLLFSRYRYLPLVPLFPELHSTDTLPRLENLSSENTILAVAGVASPRPFIRYLRCFKAKVKLMIFEDHHNFNRSDMEDILRKFNSLKSTRKLLVTTEKDAVRLCNNPYFPPDLRSCSYYVPIAVEFVPHGGQTLAGVLRQMLRNNIRQ
ncbi:MAG: tetraacyldisaccharide 4'-kinase [Muribaculaceae bacterium]|jgi:tetraacyldisaccharide 4'-kinase|nr:tetraacyldisaccharide 4'-kinase [Muribaculaceae bacterium]